MKGPSHAELHAEIAALRGMTESELKALGKRLSAVEETQRELVRVATQGKVGLRVLLWLGGLLGAALTLLAAVWSNLAGR